MKVECENLSEREATPELIRELIRDDARRGKFMILMQDADEEAFFQFAIACEGPASARGTRTLGAEPGVAGDSRTRSSTLQIATGMVTLELPQIGAKDHTRSRYYLRITQKMKPGRKRSWSYRLSLKRNRPGQISYLNFGDSPRGDDSFLTDSGIELKGERNDIV